MSLTTTQIQASLDAAYDAHLVAVKAAQYTIGNRSKTNQQIDKLWSNVLEIEAKLTKLQRGGIQIRGITTV